MSQQRRKSHIGLKPPQDKADDELEGEIAMDEPGVYSIVQRNKNYHGKMFGPLCLTTDGRCLAYSVVRDNTSASYSSSLGKHLLVCLC